MQRPSKLPSNWQAGSLSRQAQLARRAASAPRENRYARWHVASATEPESDGWLLSYLDLVSLLLVVFATLWAVGKMDSKVPEAGVTAATEQAAPTARGDASSLAATAAVLTHTAQAAITPEDDAVSLTQPEATATVMLAAPLRSAGLNPIPEADLTAYASPPLPLELTPPALAEPDLAELGREIEVIAEADAIRFRIRSEALFTPGQAELTPAGAAVLENLIKVLLRHQQPISVEGHSDSVPIKNQHFPSNWELSSSRATSVLRHLAHSGIAAQRLRATGYADTRPIASNNTVSGRAANRRVELVMPKPETQATP